MHSRPFQSNKESKDVPYKSRIFLIRSHTEQGFYIQSIENSNYREIDIKKYTPKMVIIDTPHQTYYFWCVKETSQ